MHKMDNRKPRDRQICEQRPKSIQYEVLNVICSLLYHEAMTDPRNTSGLLQDLERSLSKDEKEIKKRITQLKNKIKILDGEIKNFKKAIAAGLDIDQVIKDIKERADKIDDLQTVVDENEKLLQQKRDRWEKIAAEFAVEKTVEYQKAPGYIKRNMLQKILESCTINGKFIEAKLITGVGYTYNVESVKKAMERTGGRTGKPYDEAAQEVLTEMLADDFKNSVDFKVAESAISPQ